MSQTLFIADLHLSAERLDVRDGFVRFLATQAKNADALFILGDLFEVWIGDDLIAPEYFPVIEALLSLTQGGVPIYLQHGNRDFLLGKEFERLSGCRLIPDPYVIDLYGTPTVLMHGDMLCTDDVEYQQFRQQVRDPQWQQQFLAMPADQRIATAKHYREESKKRGQKKSSSIMDVNQYAVETALQQHHVGQMIHGHTHRPAEHHLQINGVTATRFVVGDWHDNAVILIAEAGEVCKLQILPVTYAL